MQWTELMDLVPDIAVFEMFTPKFAENLTLQCNSCTTVKQFFLKPGVSTTNAYAELFAGITFCSACTAQAKCPSMDHMMAFLY